MCFWPVRSVNTGTPFCFITCFKSRMNECTYVKKETFLSRICRTFLETLPEGVDWAIVGSPVKSGQQGSLFYIIISVPFSLSRSPLRSFGSSLRCQIAPWLSRGSFSSQQWQMHTSCLGWVGRPRLNRGATSACRGCFPGFSSSQRQTIC